MRIEFAGCRFKNRPTCKGADLQRVRCDHVPETERIPVVAHRRTVRCTLRKKDRLDVRYMAAAIHQCDSREHKSAMTEGLG